MPIAVQISPLQGFSETTLKDNPSAESGQSIREVVKPLTHKNKI
jgi:hypothetical protein